MLRDQLRGLAKTLPDLFGLRVITDGKLTENLIRLLHAAADRIEELEAQIPAPPPES